MRRPTFLDSLLWSHLFQQELYMQVWLSSSPLPSAHSSTVFFLCLAMPSRRCSTSAATPKRAEKYLRGASVRFPMALLEVKEALITHQCRGRIRFCFAAVVLKCKFIQPRRASTSRTRRCKTSWRRF